MLARQLKESILRTLNYADLPGYPGVVSQLQSLEELVYWLGNTDFTMTTNSGCYAAEQELIRVANSLQYQSALRKFADWAQAQPQTNAFFARIVQRDVRRIRECLASGTRQDACELSYTLAHSMCDEDPTLRPKLAEWVISLKSSM
jgi:hypothetical protein